MTIDIQILTTTAAILDADGRTGVGTIRIRPNQPFQYNDGVTDIQVTDAVVEIAVSGGQLQSALTLAPNTGASNVPTSTYYIVEVDVNTITYTEFWRLSNTPTSLEWGEVTRLSNPEDAGGDLLTAHIQASNPHRGYLLRSDTVDAVTAGAVSDGRGPVLRANASDGKIPTNGVAEGSITAGAVTEAKIGALAVTAAKIAADAVTTDKILDANVTLAKIANLTAARILGRASGAGTGVTTELTAAQVAAIVVGELVKQTITNGVTTSAPSQDAVYDQCVAPLANKQGAFGVLETAITFAANAYNTASLTSSTSRLYFAFVVVSAGTTLGGSDLSVNNYRNIRLVGDAGAASNGPTAISGEAYAHAGGVEYLNVKVFYTTVY